MLNISSIRTYFSSFLHRDKPTEDVRFSEDFKGPITRELMIEPTKTTCRQGDGKTVFHVFEKLALMTYLRSSSGRDQLCPMCRANITSAVPDEALARKIQNEFIRLDRNNQRYFEKVKRDLRRDPSYPYLRNQPIFPTPPVIVDGIQFVPISINVSKFEPIKDFLNFCKNVKCFVLAITSKQYYGHLFHPEKAPAHPDSERIYYSGFHGSLRKVSHSIINLCNRIVLKFKRSP